ncbi:hypothetical protein [Microbacterium sp. 3J1]|uniref:hypothetical protein n=1 Tax=Microbacterium sp. 3J1 TaxID=861269 RepID=UPI000A97062F|nr:hypothetical protein [Microbacterium sp. 3J1]
MPDADETSELRALHARAYGRGGGLTEADAARLRALEDARVEARRTVSTDSPVVAADASEPHAEPADADRPEQVAAASTPGEAAVPPTSDETAVPRASNGLRADARRHWKALTAAAVAMLLVGLGAGWALFGGAEDGVVLTAAQQERRVELQTAGGYDPGSVHVIGSDEGAVVWYATRKQGELECMILDADGDSTDLCQNAEELVAQGFGITATLAGSRGESEREGEDDISATAVRSASGEVVAIIQRWPSDDVGWLAQFPIEERERAEELLSLGFQQYSFSVVGYIDDLPIWRGTRVEDGIAQECMIVDAVGATQCADAAEVQGGAALSVGGVVVDEAGGEQEPWSIDLRLTTSGIAYLTITGEVPSSRGTTPDVFTELSGQDGDPIRVEAPSDPTG